MTTSTARSLPRLRRVFAVIATVAVLLALASLGISRSHAEQARVIAPPAADEAHPAGAAATSETAVLAGGCFWGVQGVFQHVNGVTSAVSGYAGGERSTAEYETVSSGTTGHAESVRVTFDPRQISFGRILQIYFSVGHDPTELNRQGPDSGTQYRSEIFAQSPEQASVSKQYIAQLNAAHAFDAAIVTRVELNKAFFPAEGYHQDYLTLNPTQPYIAINDLPKVANLKRLFPDVYRADPVLVKARH
jgi:peptide-methionine (S)-S-oxide reductase